MELESTRSQSVVSSGHHCMYPTFRTISLKCKRNRRAINSPNESIIKRFFRSLSYFSVPPSGILFLVLTITAGKRLAHQD
ncbi:hypothetical protein SJAG_06187 [Schizosaccharomyces japonicus yFS275]|uniref:Uncharacterized protein n=1 Tax=Schizosaccharomyces japonicus (strain yFS275 / FY16936) TaxID=402676 RepID=T0TB16_SCHJY|nr:hypothetical protein SJAG_06187 [Schizosaccharomyces japonicus yFS275]EQC53013.1 hypothetical protein SJAG_06187 [Schizosaccharomyces japonicus yFS275]